MGSIIIVITKPSGAVKMSEVDFLKEMGKRIMARRKALCFTQEALAEKLMYQLK